MKKIDLLASLGNVNTRHIAEAKERADNNVKNSISQNDDCKSERVGIMDEKKYIKKKLEPFIAIAAAVILCVGTLVYITIRNDNDAIKNGSSTSEPQKSETFDSSEESKLQSDISSDKQTLVDKVNIQSMSLPYLMHSAVYNQGEVMEDKTSSFGWNGDMQLIINSAQIKDYDAVSDDVTFESWDLYLDMFEEPKVLLVDVSLENINAQKPSGVKYEFSMQMFSLALESDFYSENYNDAEYFNVFLEEKSAFEAYCSVHGQGDDYYTFELPEGETLDFQLAFLIDSSLLDTEEQLLLALGTTSRATDAILLDSIS